MSARARVGVVLFAATAACSPTTQDRTPPAPAALVDASAPADAAVPDATVDATAEAVDPDPSYDQILAILGIDAPSCATMPAEARIRCAIDARFAADPKAASLGYELWVKWRIVPGVEQAQTMDGGYRGRIRLEPAVPVNADRRQLEWIVAAMSDLDRFWDALDRFQAPHEGTPTRYRYKPITLRFMRSMDKKRTPSAYAYDWTVAWNLAGSLHTSGDAVRETLVHEIFHLNDRVHGRGGDRWWSEPALGSDYDAIVRKCGTALACLAPYSPNETIVRGGTYYSFQPGNGVVEYAAELALRYYREQRAALSKLASAPKPFKCGPPENARAWEKMRNEFFGGVDAVPPCRS